MTEATPEEFPGATPHLCVRSVDMAVRFYREAFDADELTRSSGPDGRVWHCELLVAGGRLLLVEEFPDTGTVSPETLGGTPVTLHLFVADTDATYRRALDAGASALMPPADAFWGDRYAQIVDPSGHRWSMSTRHEDLSGDDMAARGNKWRQERGNPTSPGQVPGAMAEGEQ